MKGWKAQVDEGGVRVPLFMQWKNHLPKGKTVNELASHIDLMPTLMDLCGIENGNHPPFDGKSLVSLLKDEKNDWQERNIYSIQNDGTWNDFPASVRNNRYRLVKDNAQNILLYDMVNDPSQTTNIAKENPQIARKLQTDLENWFKDVTKNGIELPLAEVGHDESPIVHLPAPEAKLSKNLAFEGDRGWANDWIKGWKFDDKAVWKVKVVEPGTYTVSILYTSENKGFYGKISDGKTNIGDFIKEAYPSDFLPSPDRVKRGEVYEKSWKKQELGAFEWDAGEKELALYFEKIPKNAALNVKEIVVEKKLKD